MVAVQLTHLPLTSMLIAAGLQCGTVGVLGWLQLRRHRRGVAGALELVKGMGVPARVIVKASGEVQIDPVLKELEGNPKHADLTSPASDDPPMDSSRDAPLATRPLNGYWAMVRALMLASPLLARQLKFAKHHSGSIRSNSMLRGRHG